MRSQSCSNPIRRCRIEVAGHTDNTGGADHNMKLSLGRAAAVVNALVGGYGIERTRLLPKGYGDTKPVAPNDSDQGRAKNRRVELRSFNAHPRAGSPPRSAIRWPGSIGLYSPWR